MLVCQDTQQVALPFQKVPTALFFTAGFSCCTDSKFLAWLNGFVIGILLLISSDSVTVVPIVSAQHNGFNATVLPVGKVFPPQVGS